MKILLTSIWPSWTRRDARKKVSCSVKTTENKKEKKEIIDSETKREWEVRDAEISETGYSRCVASHHDYWATSELGITHAELSKRIGISGPGVGYGAERGKLIAKENGYQLMG